MCLAAADGRARLDGPTLGRHRRGCWRLRERLDQSVSVRRRSSCTYADGAELKSVLEALEPSLTATVQGETDAAEFAASAC